LCKVLCANAFELIIIGLMTRCCVTDAVVKALCPLELDSNNLPRVDYATMRTNVPWLFCGGDLAGVAQTTVESVNDGKTASLSIHKYIQVR